MKAVYFLQIIVFAGLLCSCEQSVEKAESFPFISAHSWMIALLYPYFTAASFMFIHFDMMLLFYGFLTLEIASL